MDKLIFFIDNAEVRQLNSATENNSTHQLYGDFWFTLALKKNNWTAIVAKSAPFLTEGEREIILAIAGDVSVNPLIVLTYVVFQNQSNQTDIANSDTRFYMSLKKSITPMANDFDRFDSILDPPKPSAFIFSIWSAMNEDDNKLQTFLQIYRTIQTKNRIVLRNPTIDIKVTTRDDDMPSTIFPWPEGECWQIGGTHKSGAALDMAPDLFHAWRQPFDYLNSDGAVHSSFGGTVYLHSSCGLEVMNNTYSIYYSHISTHVEHNSTVSQGDFLGYIDLAPATAMCQCDWTVGKYACSTGPHVHWALRKDGRHETLDNKEISGYIVTAGTYDYDQYCTDPEDCQQAKSKNNNQSCATMFTSPNGDVMCPSIKGANIGTCSALIYVIK